MIACRLAGISTSAVSPAELAAAPPVALLELAEELPEFAVEALHFEIVVGHVAPHLRAVGEVLEELDVAEVHAALPAGVELVSTVRIAGPEPEAERLVGFARGLFFGR